MHNIARSAHSTTVRCRTNNCIRKHSSRQASRGVRTYIIAAAILHFTPFIASCHSRASYRPWLHLVRRLLLAIGYAHLNLPKASTAAG